MGDQSANVSFGSHNSGVQIGQSFAPIHIAPERPETPPVPSTNVPFRRDPHFVERDDLLNRIDQKFSFAAARVALVGLGGVGKTQQAVEYSYRVRERSRDKWVLWIHASSVSQFEQSVRSIVERVRIKGRKDPNADIFQLFRAWLEDPGKGSWSVVLDNADDASFLVDKTHGDEATTTMPLFQCIPVCEHGSILITTRSRKAALELVDSDDIIRMYPMDEEHALLLLEKKLGDGVDRDDLKRLATALECIPLAVAQAAAYIKRKEWRNSVQDYLRGLQSIESDADFIGNEMEESHGPAAETHAVMRTWQISFEHLYTTRKSAADLLSLMSLCDRQSIPEILLCTENNSKGQQQCEEDIETLLSFSFISVNSANGTFGMHRLVQLATRRWLALRNDLERHLQRFILDLDRTLPSGEYESWSIWQMLVPHVTAAATLVPSDQSDQLLWASVMYRTALYTYVRRGLLLLSRGVEFCEASWAVRTKLLGEFDIRSLESMRLLANCYSELSRHQEALGLGEKCFALSSAYLGERHADTLRSMSDVGSFHNSLGHLRKAADFEDKCLELRREIYGEEHKDTLESMRALTGHLWDLGERDQAVDTIERCWAIQKRTLGEAHRETLQSMNDFAWYLFELGDADKALEMETSCWKMRDSVLGPDHGDTLHSMNNIALYYQDLGENEKGIEMGERCWAGKREVLGETHHSTLMSLHNLAIHHHEIGKDDKALELAEKCYEMRLKTLGTDHPDAIGEMGVLAACYSSLGDYAKAIQTSERCWQLRKSKLGKDHPNTLHSMMNLAWYYSLDHQLARAIPLLEECVALSVSKLGEDDPNTRHRVYNLDNMKDQAAKEAAKEAAASKKRHKLMDKFRRAKA